MTSCVHLDVVEDLVLGTLAPERADELRAHLERCEDCALAHAMFAEERALFAQRAEVVAAPPRLALPAPAAPRPVARLARLAQRAMRSQALPALAAAVFLFAGVSRLGTSSSRISAAPEPNGASEADEDLRGGVHATLRPVETLSCATDDTNAACLTNVGASTFAIANGSSDSATCEGDGLAMSRALSSMCELSVTSSRSRQ